MGYIKTAPRRWSITVGTMDTHQAGQEETLIRMEMDRLRETHPRRASRGCFRCAVALAAVIGVLFVLLLVGFILQYFLFKPSDIPECPSYPLEKTDEEGSYDIFAAEKDARYLVYGWVTFPRVTDDEVTLFMLEGSKPRYLQSQKINKTTIFLFAEATLVVGHKIRIRFRPNFSSSSFHVREL